MQAVRFRFFSIAFAVFLTDLPGTFAQDRVSKQVFAQQAVVVSAHPEASRIGLEILQKGGNAFDAAVAVEFVLAVAYPIAGNIGGGGLLVYRMADGSIGALDYREKAPAAAHRDMYLDEQGRVIEKLSQDGHLAAGVPGTVAGMWELHQKFGSLPFADLVAPSVQLAQKGVVLTNLEADRLNYYREEFVRLNTFMPHAVKKEGTFTRGEVLKHPDLAKTLKRIQKQGRDGFYTGKTADLIVAEMQKGGGIISKQDLVDYQALWRKPLQGRYRNLDIITMSPPSSGGIILLQCLQMLEPFELWQYEWQDLRRVQLIVESERRAYADRAAHAGDADYYPVPLKALLNKDYLRARMSDFSFERATLSSEVSAGDFSNKPAGEETTHYTIVDPYGNAVSVTTTLNGAYGSKVIVQGAGFFLNNEMDDFSIKPGAPNLYGLVGGEANAIAPGKRMLSSMTPTIVEKDGKLLMTVGTPGGSTIPTSVLQTLLNVTDFGMGMHEAVQAPRFHHQWLPDKVFCEADTFNENQLQSLENLGYSMQKRENIGRVEGILVLPDGSYEGAADKRGDDTALGF